MRMLTKGQRSIILNIDEKHNYKSSLVRKLGFTISTVAKSTKELLQMGILVHIKSKNRRTKFLELTKKGQYIKDLLLKLKRYAR